MKPLALYALSAFALSLSTQAFSKSYETNFDLVEDPISEGGVWLHEGLDWTTVRTNNGVACGTHHATGYDDSYAHLSGFGPDQASEAIVYKSGSFSANQEIELHLRWSDSEHNARGYEVLVEANNHYAYIVRWNGALGDFTILSSSSTFSLPRTPVSGDVLRAQMVGSEITVYFNGDQVGSITDTTWTDGNPGIGFYSDDPSGEPNDRFCFTSFSATDDLSAGSAPKPPVILPD